MRYEAFDRSITPTTPRGSLDASTMPADSIATSVPAPMAMPTSALASAGASFTPSPTMATVRPRFWSSVTFESFSFGSTWGERLVDAELGRYCIGHLDGVTGDHDDLSAAAVEAVDGFL